MWPINADLQVAAYRFRHSNHISYKSDKWGNIHFLGNGGTRPPCNNDTSPNHDSNDIPLSHGNNDMVHLLTSYLALISVLSTLCVRTHIDTLCEDCLVRTHVKYLK